jgi:hypothetical protein
MTDGNRGRARHVALAGAAIVALLACAAYVGATALLGAGARRGVRELTRLAAARGVELTAVELGAARIDGLGAVSWTGLSARLRCLDPELPLQQGDFAFHAERLRVRAEDLGARRFSVRLTGATLAPARPQPSSAAAAGEEPRIGRLAVRAFGLQASVDPLSRALAAAQLGEVLRELRELARTGRCALPVELDGTVTFPVGGAPVEARVRTLREGDATVLVMDETDLVALSARMRLRVPLTAAEAAYVARHPVQAPRLLRIEDEASARAAELARREPLVSEDAYRHILWSYLLTRAFDEEVARAVTDAHERGLTGNSPAESAMDQANNELGRWYARTGVPEQELAAKVLGDPRVIRAGTGGRPRASRAAAAAEAAPR